MLEWKRGHDDIHLFNEKVREWEDMRFGIAELIACPHVTRDGDSAASSCSVHQAARYFARSVPPNGLRGSRRGTQRRQSGGDHTR